LGIAVYPGADATVYLAVASINTNQNLIPGGAISGTRQQRLLLGEERPARARGGDGAGFHRSAAVPRAATLCLAPYFRGSSAGEGPSSGEPVGSSLLPCVGKGNIRQLPRGFESSAWTVRSLSTSMLGSIFSYCSPQA
jgi:hypothetical protein